MSKILIIEDDPIVSNVYRNKLAVEGLTVECAPDGETGLKLLHSFRPDAVLLDLMLPGISGVEVLRQARAEAQFEKLPIIVLSNTYLTSMIQDAWKAGATKCLSKANSTPKSVVDVLRALTQPPVGVETRKPTAPYSHVSYPSGTAPRPKSGSAMRDEAFQSELSSSFNQTLPAAVARSILRPRRRWST